MRTLRCLFPLILGLGLSSFFAGAAELARPFETVTPSNTAATLTRTFSGKEPLAEVVELPPLKMPAAPRKSTVAAPPAKSSTKKPAAKPTALSAVLPGEGIYKMILSGVLDGDLEIGVEDSPVLIRGNFAVTENVTLKVNPGTLVHLRADPRQPKPAAAGVPDPSQSAVVWIWGALLTEGVTGNPVEFLNQEKTPASLLLYGNEQTRLDGLRLSGMTVSQTAGTLLWTNCELVGVSHYALGGGIAVFTHCNFKSCGGVFATYSLAPWSLLMRRNIFESCREGVVLGSDPGESRLIIEKNHFLNTRGAHIRAMPVVNAKGVPDRNFKPRDLELLIGENWYGNALPEEVELRLVDRRIDPTVRARLNTRPPAERPYANTGAGVNAAVIAATLREQHSAQQKLLNAHPTQKPKTADAEKKPAAAMSKAVKKPN